MGILEEIEKAKKVKEMALSFDGVSEAKLFHTKYVVVDERVRFQCRYSGCRDFGASLMCPPYTPEVDEFKKVLSQYYIALLVLLEGDIKDKKNWERESNQWALKLHDIIYRLEKKAFSLGFPFAAGLIGGSCKLCENCQAKKDLNAKCINREKARPSMEAMGIDVLSTCKAVGTKIEFSSNKVTWVGMVLLA